MEKSQEVVPEVQEEASEFKVAQKTGWYHCSYTVTEEQFARAADKKYVISYANHYVNALILDYIAPSLLDGRIYEIRVNSESVSDIVGGHDYKRVSGISYLRHALLLLVNWEDAEVGDWASLGYMNARLHEKVMVNEKEFIPVYEKYKGGHRQIAWKRIK